MNFIKKGSTKNVEPFFVLFNKIYIMFIIFINFSLLESYKYCYFYLILLKITN